MIVIKICDRSIGTFVFFLSNFHSRSLVLNTFRNLVTVIYMKTMVRSNPGFKKKQHSNFHFRTLYNAVVREQELIRTVDSPSYTLQQHQQIPASPPAVRQQQISTDSQPLPAVSQPLLAVTQSLPAASLLVLKRPCEPTSTGSSKKDREI